MREAEIIELALRRASARIGIEQHCRGVTIGAASALDLLADEIAKMLRDDERRRSQTEVRGNLNERQKT